MDTHGAKLAAKAQSCSAPTGNFWFQPPRGYARNLPSHRKKSIFHKGRIIQALVCLWARTTLTVGQAPASSSGQPLKHRGSFHPETPDEEAEVMLTNLFASYGSERRRGPAVHWGWNASPSLTV